MLKLKKTPGFLGVSLNSTTDIGVVLEGNFEKLFSCHKENSFQSVGKPVQTLYTKYRTVFYFLAATLNTLYAASN